MVRITPLFIALLFFFSERLSSQTIVINEILASNSAINTDEDGSFEDWIELFNVSSETISLNGYGLTDNPSNPYKWIFPDYRIAPGEHLLIWCSDKNRANPSLPLHTNFKISADGENIRLTDLYGMIVDEIPAMVNTTNISYGRSISGGPSFIFFEVPTPGQANVATGPTEILAEPIFSVNSGFYNNSFALSITHPDPEVTILYTLDGSEPKSENLSGKTYFYKNQYREFPGDSDGTLLQTAYSTLYYSQPFEIKDRSNEPDKIAKISTTFNFYPYYIPQEPVSKSTVVRAIALKNGSVSKTVTKNYFISSTISSLPVVSINVDEDLLFDYEKGIHVAGKDFDDWRDANPNSSSVFSNANYARSGDAWEMKANFSLYKNGLEEFSQDVGIRIHGGFTRVYPNKSLRIYARSEYGNGSLDYPFFSDLNYNSYKTLILRNSGNDVNSTYFRDAFIQRTVAHLNLDTQAYQPTITFINGEYWGMLNMRERYDKHYFKRIYNISESELDFLENNALIQEGDNSHYMGILAFLENNDLSNDDNYNYITTQLDPENFTDFFITNIYARNTDWPHNNIEFWRKKTDIYDPEAPFGLDGRWRWILKDTDFGFGNDGGPASYEHDTLAFATATGGNSDTNPEWSTFVFRKLLENNTFKTKFINRFADLMNTAFLPERVTGIISEMKTEIENDILKHGQRWKSINSLSEWNNNIDVMIGFANQRFRYQRIHIREKFGLSANIQAKIDVSGSEQGFVKINTINLNPSTPGVSNLPYPWTGVYFKDIPVTLKAVALDGYKFSYWSGAVESFNPEITITPSSDFNITAHFVSTELITDRVPIYFWALNNSLPAITSLVSIDSSYEINENTMMSYNSCLEGYPFMPGHPEWRKASMERHYSPTDLNYLATANHEISYEDAGIMGIKIKQPFQNENRENTLVFNLPSTGFKNIVVAFAAKNRNAADAILLDYSVNPGQPIWLKTGLMASQFSLSSEYNIFEIDFKHIFAINDNPNFKIRIRFSGSDMTVENQGYVIFNNVSAIGSEITLSKNAPDYQKFQVYPNPFTDILHVLNYHSQDVYRISTIEGKLIKQGQLSSEIDVSELSKGMYILQLSSEGKTETKKLIKK